MRRALVVLACLGAVGCVSSNVLRLDETVRPAVPLDAVVVLAEAPQQHYSVIAVIEAKGGSAFDSFDDLRDEMVAEAARLGGDALILGPEDTETNFIITGVAMIPSDERRLVGQVIVYERGDTE